MNENADEIAKALRAQANCEKFYREHNDCYGCQMPYKENPSHQKMCVRFDKEVVPHAADLIENLQAQLSESQRRERAAVEDFADFIVERCDCLRIALDTQDRHYLEQLIKQWRGPQESGEETE